MPNKVLDNQDFKCLKGSILNQEVPLNSYNPTNFVYSRSDLTVVYAATIGTFKCSGNKSAIEEADVAEASKRGFDS